ncbi:phage holin family protein [Rhodoferax sp. 4810]|nr:phage holin family protein [Rhodoferax jenense]
MLASLRQLVGTLVEIAQVRLALLGTEIEVEKRRLFDGLLWAGVALLLLGLGLVLLCGFVVLLLWDGYRLAAVATLAVLFLAGGALSMQHAKQRLRSSSGMFNASLAELQQDTASLAKPVGHE